MRRMWSEIKDHRLSAALFLLYWVIVFGLDLFRWHKPRNRPEDMVRTVIYLHFLLPVIAGALVSWWRRYRPGRIMSGMVAGAAVIVVDAAALLTHALVAFHLGESGGSSESIFELPVFLIAIGLFGSVLGLIGAAGSTGLGHLLDRWQQPPAGLASPPAFANHRAPIGGARGIIPRRVPLLAGGLVLGAAVIVALLGIPAVTADTFPGAAPEKAATAFSVNAILNVLIGIALLAPVSRRSAGAGKGMVVMAGFAGLLLGSALLDAASALAAHGPRMRVAAVACFGCAAGDLGAGALALVAALRRHGKDDEVALPVSGVAASASRAQCCGDPNARGKS